jgi:hypothetical protein
LPVSQRIDFSENPGRQAAPSVIHFALDELEQASMQLEWGYQQLSGALKLADAG